MRFLADMGVSNRVVEWLREEGHDATHLRDEGLHRTPDADIFQKAIQEQRIVITFDLDFGAIAAASAKEVVSVIIFRLAASGNDKVINSLRKVISESSDVLREGAVVTVEDFRHRIRRLPIGD